MYATVPTTIVGAVAAALELGDQAEIEEHDAAIAGDLDVRRLDVAVDLARRVERVEPARELGQRARSLSKSHGDGIAARTSERIGARPRVGPRPRPLAPVFASRAGVWVVRATASELGGRRAPQVGEEVVAVERAPS